VLHWGGVVAWEDAKVERPLEMRQPSPNRACSLCGQGVHCGADEDLCWCEDVALTERQRAALAELNLEGCLCRDCLERLPTRERLPT
jgi:hypothetical protein